MHVELEWGDSDDHNYSLPLTSEIDFGCVVMLIDRRFFSCSVDAENDNVFSGNPWVVAEINDFEVDLSSRLHLFAHR